MFPVFGEVGLEEASAVAVFTAYGAAGGRVLVVGEGFADIGEQLDRRGFAVVLLAEDCLEGAAGFFWPVAAEGVGQGDECPGRVLLVG